jgi:hypothetical protein
MDARMGVVVVCLAYAAVDLGIRAIAYSRGRKLPWILSAWTPAPAFENSRLNRIDKVLMNVFLPLGIVLIVVGWTLMLPDHSSSGSVVLGIGILTAFARQLFLLACLAFADRAGESTQLRSV